MALGDSAKTPQDVASSETRQRHIARRHHASRQLRRQVKQTPTKTITNIQSIPEVKLRRKKDKMLSPEYADAAFNSSATSDLGCVSDTVGSADATVLAARTRGQSLAMCPLHRQM